MEARQAAETLQHIEHLRRGTRATLASFWFPLVLFGVLTLASAVVAWRAWGPAVGAYWAVAGPLGGAVTAAYHRRRERALGVEGPWVAHALTGAGIVVGCFLAAGLGQALDSEATIAVAPALVVSAGYLVFACLDRSAMLAAVAAALAAAAAALAATGLDPRQLAAIVALLYGATFLATGVAYRRIERRG